MFNLESIVLAILTGALGYVIRAVRSDHDSLRATFKSHRVQKLKALFDECIVQQEMQLSISAAISETPQEKRSKVNCPLDEPYDFELATSDSTIPYRIQIASIGVSDSITSFRDDWVSRDDKSCYESYALVKREIDNLLNELKLLAGLTNRTGFAALTQIIPSVLSWLFGDAHYLIKRKVGWFARQLWNPEKPQRRLPGSPLWPTTDEREIAFDREVRRAEELDRMLRDKNL